MKRRLLAAVLALALALGGGVVLLRYVTGADRRAMAGMSVTTVLVATTTVPAGTSAADLAGMVTSRSLPAVAVAASAVHDLAALQGKVSTGELSPGEQVLATRFADPATAQLPPKLPNGTQQVSVTLDPQRAVNGDLAPGDEVGVFLSTDVDNRPRTHLVGSQVLVVRVTGVAVSGQASPAGADGSDGPRQGSATAGATSGGAAGGTNAVTVTLAVRAPLAERLVFASEHGTVWLSKQSNSTSDAGRSVITEGNLYR